MNTKNNNKLKDLYDLYKIISDKKYDLNNMREYLLKNLESIYKYFNKDLFKFNLYNYINSEYSKTNGLFYKDNYIHATTTQVYIKIFKEKYPKQYENNLVNHKKISEHKFDEKMLSIIDNIISTNEWNSYIFDDYSMNTFINQCYSINNIKNIFNDNKINVYYKDTNIKIDNAILMLSFIQQFNIKNIKVSQNLYYILINDDKNTFLLRTLNK